MATADRMPPRRPLTHCRDCGCALLYPVTVETGFEGRAIVTRRCPECEVVDVVSCDAIAVIIWLRREAEIRADLLASLDAGGTGS